MNARQAHALTHPLENPATDSTDRLTTAVAQRDGNLLLSILAVDR